MLREPPEPPPRRERSSSRQLGAGCRLLSTVCHRGQEESRRGSAGAEGPRHHIHIRILHFGSKAQDKGDSRSLWFVASLCLRGPSGSYRLRQPWLVRHPDPCADPKSRSTLGFGNPLAEEYLSPELGGSRIHYVRLYHTTPHHTTPHHTTPYHTIPYHTIPYHTIPYHTIPYHTVQRWGIYTILYHTIQSYAILCYTVQNWGIYFSDPRPRLGPFGGESQGGESQGGSEAPGRSPTKRGQRPLPGGAVAFLVGWAFGALWYGLA